MERTPLDTYWATKESSDPSELSECTLIKIEKIFFINKNQFSGTKLKIEFFSCLNFFSPNTSKFSYFIHSDDCVGKIRSKSIRLQLGFVVNKKTDFSIEKMRNSGNCIYDYAHPLVEKDF